MAIKLMIQLVRVVAYLHDQGIIHRDLKPANALVRHDGTLKLIDFGLARHFDELYVRGTRVRGTPAYMAPEQIQGGDLTPATDIYQLGVCLFEMLAGRLPFDGGDMSYAHIHQDAPRVTEFKDDIDQDLADIIALCLHKDPSKRPESAHFLLDMLQTVHRKLDDSVPMAIPNPDASQEEFRFQTAELSALNIQQQPSQLTVPGATPPVPDGYQIAHPSQPNLIARTRDMEALTGPATSPSGSQISYVAIEPTGNKRSGLIIGLLCIALGAMGAIIYTQSQRPEPAPPVTAAATQEPKPAETTPETEQPKTPPAESPEGETPPAVDLDNTPSDPTSVVENPEPTVEAPEPEVKPSAPVQAAKKAPVRRVVRKPAKKTAKKVETSKPVVETPPAKPKVAKKKKGKENTKGLFKLESTLTKKKTKKKKKESGTGFLPMQ